MGQFGLKIRFAHRTFRWSNEAKGVAAVHCVIIGFGLREPWSRTIFEYDDIAGLPHGVGASNINGCLVDGPDVFLANRDAPICDVPAMRFGSMPRDGGHLVMDEAKMNELVRVAPTARKWIRPYTGAQEFLNGYRSYAFISVC